MKKLITGLVIFLCFFTVFAVGITYVFIHDAPFSHLPSSKEMEGIDLYGTYDENDLIVDSITESYNGTDVNIPQLSGLKNASVQNKINDHIYNSMYEIINKHPKINYANYYLMANFANVFSLSVSVGFDEEPYYEALRLNYNLTDGSQLKLEDLFADDADLLEIVRSAFYKEMALYNFQSETNVHSPDEEELYKVVKAYMAGDKEFAFSPASIYLYSQDYSATVKMIDIADKIAIYSKYTSHKNLYTGEYEGRTGIITCSDSGQYSIFDNIEYGLKGDNLWYDICYGSEYFPEDVPSDIKTDYLAFRGKAYEDIYASIDSYREKAKENPDKFYILLMKPSISLDRDGEFIDGSWEYEYYDTATIYHNTQLFEMPLALYEEVYKDELLDSYRYEYFAMRGGVWLDTENTHGATVTKNYSSEKINYITGELVSKEDTL